MTNKNIGIDDQKILDAVREARACLDKLNALRDEINQIRGVLDAKEDASLSARNDLRVAKAHLQKVVGAGAQEIFGVYP